MRCNKFIRWRICRIAGTAYEKVVRLFAVLFCLCGRQGTELFHKVQDCHLQCLTKVSSNRFTGHWRESSISPEEIRISRPDTLCNITILVRDIKARLLMVLLKQAVLL